MAKIKFRIDLFAPETFPSEILVGLVREYNEDKVTVKFPTSKECIIEGDEIKIRKRDIEKTLNIDLPLTSDWCNYMINNPIWQKSVAEIDGKIQATTDELTISISEKRELMRVPVGLNLVAHIKNKKDYEIFSGTITDLTMAGVGISSAKLPELEQMIELSFEFQDLGLQFDNVQAIVEWKREDLHRFGARWIELKEEDKNLLRYLAPVKV